jgi:hypothetical protein
MGEKRNEYRSFVGIAGGKTPPGISKCRRKYDIKTDVK